jgi:hypothetical protein
MKRDDLVNIISQELEDMDFSYEDEEDRNDFADYLLRRLEGLGMLPPPQACKIIYDKKGPKHNEATRQWDDEQ